MDGKPVKVTWLQHRPGKGVGCTVCANSLHKAQMAQTHMKKSRYAAFNVKFARFEVASLSSLQASTFRLHKSSRVHKRALTVFAQPQLPVYQPIPEDSAAFDKQARLLRGHVPQIVDSVYAWHIVDTAMSFSSGSKMTATLSYLNTMDRRTAWEHPVHRKALQKMVLVLAECLREQTREVLRKAESWSLSFDDRVARNLIHSDFWPLIGI